MTEDFTANRIFEIPLQKIRADPTQPRKYFNELDLRELADSIKEQGLLQPIMVKPNGDGTFLIIHGERRFRAHELGAMRTIKCIVVDKSDSEIQDARVTENLVRADLSDMELAKEFQRRVDAGETHEQIAHSIKKSRAFVTQRLSLLRLPEDRQKQLEEGKISFADARVIVASNDIPTTENSVVENQHCYAVTMESLEVYKLFKQSEKPDLKTLHEAYRKDLITIRRALQ
jgi:ParB family chromosome partitioning protein